MAEVGRAEKEKVVIIIIINVIIIITVLVNSCSRHNVLNVFATLKIRRE